MSVTSRTSWSRHSIIIEWWWVIQGWRLTQSILASYLWTMYPNKKKRKWACSLDHLHKGDFWLKDFTNLYQINKKHEQDKRSRHSRPQKWQGEISQQLLRIGRILFNYFVIQPPKFWSNKTIIPPQLGLWRSRTHIHCDSNKITWYHTDRSQNHRVDGNQHNQSELING